MLRFVVEHIEVHRYPPTIREICEALGIASTNGVSDHLRALERKGHLHRGPCKSRALVPTTRGLRAAGRQTFETIDVPVLSAAAGAGYHRTAPDHDGTSVEEVLRLDRTLLGDGEGLYALRVCGTSMVGDGIRDNDYVFLRPLDGAWPENGIDRFVLARLERAGLRPTPRAERGAAGWVCGWQS